MRTKKQKSLKPSRNSDFGGKQLSENKLTQLSLHLETLLEYGINFRDRIITIKNDIDADEFARIDAAMSEMESNSRKSVTIRINSPGGEVYHALAIVGRLRASKCRIITEGYGHVMSAATLILACGDERRMSEYGWFMTHEASYEVKGTHSQIKQTVAQAEKEEVSWASWMQEHSERDLKFWRSVISNKDSYYSPNELLELGVIDEVI